jgi:hypothetical protein
MRLPTHVSDSTTQVGQDHVAIGVLLILGTNKQPSEPKHTNSHSGNFHGSLPVLHRSDRWLVPVRPVTPVRPVGRADQADGYSSRTTNVPESLSDFSRPWNKNTPKHNLQGRRTLYKPKENTSKTAKNLLATTRPKDTQNKQLTRGKSHKRHTPVRPVTSTGQTGHAWAARDEQHPRVNSPQTNSRSPDSLHGFKQDFGGSRNTSWALHSQVMVHQNSLNQEESKGFYQEHHNP